MAAAPAEVLRANFEGYVFLNTWSFRAKAMATTAMAISLIFFAILPSIGCLPLLVLTAYLNYEVFTVSHNIDKIYDLPIDAGLSSQDLFDRITQRAPLTRCLTKDMIEDPNRRLGTAYYLRLISGIWPVKYPRILRN